MFSLKKISVLICVLFSISLFNFVDAYDRFAKVVVIGLTGSGKTVLYNLLTHSNKSINDTVHDKNISTEKVNYNVDSKSICVYFGDTSGEPKHKDLMEAFCHNANIVFITLDAVDLIRSKLRPTFMPKSWSSFLFKKIQSEKDEALDYLETLIGNLYKYAPNCRVVVVLTKMEQIDRIYEGDDNKKWKGAKRAIKNYMEEICDVVDGNVDATYDLTLYDPKSKDDLEYLKKTEKEIIQDTNEHRTKLENIIKECLRKYGIDKLPDTSDGMRAEVIKEMVGWHKVVDEKEGTCSSEKSHLEATYEDKLYVK